MIEESDAYTVSILWRLPGDERDRRSLVHVMASSILSAQSQARLVWLDKRPPGASYLGASATKDRGQLWFSM